MGIHPTILSLGLFLRWSVLLKNLHPYHYPHQQMSILNMYNSHLKEVIIRVIFSNIHFLAYCVLETPSGEASR